MHSSIRATNLHIPRRASHGLHLEITSAAPSTNGHTPYSRVLINRIRNTSWDILLLSTELLAMRMLLEQALLLAQDEDKGTFPHLCQPVPCPVLHAMKPCSVLARENSRLSV